MRNGYSINESVYNERASFCVCVTVAKKRKLVARYRSIEKDNGRKTEKSGETEGTARHFRSIKSNTGGGGHWCVASRELIIIIRKVVVLI